MCSDKQSGQNNEVVFKRISNYATGVHFYHIRIPVNISKIVETPQKMKKIKSFMHNVNHQSLKFYMDNKKGERIDKHLAHLAAHLMKDSIDFILNT
jgi:hypothetical protein